MAQTKYEGPREALDQYARIIEAHPDAVLKGAKNPYTSLNGNMHSFLGKDGTLALRLSPEDRETFIEAFDTRLAISHDTVMKEYVDVPADLFSRTDEILEWFAKSYLWVSTLKPNRAGADIAKSI